MSEVDSPWVSQKTCRPFSASSAAVAPSAGRCGRAARAAAVAWEGLERRTFGGSVGCRREAARAEIREGAVSARRKSEARVEKRVWMARRGEPPGRCFGVAFIMSTQSVLTNPLSASCQTSPDRRELK